MIIGFIFATIGVLIALIVSKDRPKTLYPTGAEILIAIRKADRDARRAEAQCWSNCPDDSRKMPGTKT